MGLANRYHSCLVWENSSTNMTRVRHRESSYGLDMHSITSDVTYTILGTAILQEMTNAERFIFCSFPPYTYGFCVLLILVSSSNVGIRMSHDAEEFVSNRQHSNFTYVFTDRNIKTRCNEAAESHGRNPYVSTKGERQLESFNPQSPRSVREKRNR